jgi:hypothetical protein
MELPAMTQLQAASPQAWQAVSPKAGRLASRLVALLHMAAWLTLTALAGTAFAQSPVYRCPGPPVLYTDGLSAAEAKERNCRTIEGAPVTVVQSPRKPASTPNGSATAATGKPADSKIDPAAQRARDSDARRILTDELRREEDRLVAMQKEFNNGEPERRGDERNYQRYLDRVTELKAAILRKEADVAAIKRELAKLPASP